MSTPPVNHKELGPLSDEEQTLELHLTDGGVTIPGLPIPQDDIPADLPGCRFLSIIGHGGMGVVYLAKQINLGRYVAVKRLSPQHSSDQDFVRRLQVEAEIMGAFSHPNVVGIHDVVHNASGTFLVIEYIPGRLTARDLLFHFGPLPEQYVATIMLEVAKGLSAIAAHGFAHRDMKPDNILFRWTGDKSPATLEELFNSTEMRIVICDFGLAANVNMLKDENSQRIMGSLAYMSPEQLSNSEKIDFHSDMYSLAATAYFLLSGESPFCEFDTRDERLKAKMVNDIPFERLQGKCKISNEFLVILQRLGNLEPENRYESYTKLLSDLEKLQQFFSTGTMELASMLWRHFIPHPILLILLFLSIISWPSYRLWQGIRLASHARDTVLTATPACWTEDSVTGWVLQPAYKDSDNSSLTGRAGRYLETLNKYEVLHTLRGRIIARGKGQARLVILDQADDEVMIIKIWRARENENLFVKVFTADGREIPLPLIQKNKSTDAVDMHWRFTETQIYMSLAGQEVAICPLPKIMANWGVRINNDSFAILEIEDMRVIR